MIKGVDVSEVQQDIDFHWLSNQGIEFVIIKCYEGNKGKDPMYERNVLGAKVAGLKVAAYHFIYPLPADGVHPGRCPKEQAKLHSDAAGSIPFACCDLEWPEPQNWAKWGCTADQIKAWTLEYLEEYERLTGKRMVLYTYLFYGKTLQLSTEFAKYPLWIANFDFPPKMPYPWTDYVLQQTGGGTSGIKMTLSNGIPVDTDQAKDLSLWNVPVAEAPPTPEPIFTPMPVAADPPPVTIENPPPPVIPPNANFLTVLFQALQDLLNKLFKK